MRIIAPMKQGMAIVIFMGFVSTSWAWDHCGHQVVAAIAYGQLTPKAKAKIVALFEKDPRDRFFVDAASWPDDIKQGINNREPKAALDKPWHYVDIPYNASKREIAEALDNGGATPVIGKMESANAATAIKFYIDYLTSGEGSTIEQVDAISWLEHLVGDIHQPLHCITVPKDEPLNNYTPPPAGDRGGNGFALKGHTSNLHSYWDDVFDLATGSDDQGRDDSVPNSLAVAKAVVKRVPLNSVDISRTAVSDWILEGYEMRKFVYSPALNSESQAQNPTHIITQKYADDVRERCETQVVKAGLRLAHILNSIYG